MTAAAILAGGRATRFHGRDKGALAIGSRRILDRQLAALHETVDDVFIVTNQPERYADIGVSVVQDAVQGAGALGGLYTALLASPAPQVLVVACDLPFLTVPFLRHLTEAGRGVDLAIPRTSSGYEPLCASYGRRCVSAVRERLESRRLKVVDLLDAGLRVRELAAAEIARFDPDGSLFFNVNTPDDYRRAVDKFSRQNR